MGNCSSCTELSMATSLISYCRLITVTSTSWEILEITPEASCGWGERVRASRFNLFAVLVSSHEAEPLLELLGLNCGQMGPSDPRGLVTGSLGRYSQVQWLEGPLLCWPLYLCRHPRPVVESPAHPCTLGTLPSPSSPWTALGVRSGCILQGWLAPQPFPPEGLCHMSYTWD